MQHVFIWNTEAESIVEAIFFFKQIKKQTAGRTQQALNWELDKGWKKITARRLEKGSRTG